MAGYNGYSMSNNAVDAYDDGERPLSRWTKRAVVLGLCKKFNDYLHENKIDFEISETDLILIKPFKDYLRCSSWHHTSKFYNRTDFYEIDCFDNCVNQVDFKNVAGKEILAFIKNKLSEEDRSQKERDDLLYKERHAIEVLRNREELAIFKKAKPLKDYTLFEENDRIYFALPDFYKTIQSQTYGGYYETFNHDIEGYSKKPYCRCFAKTHKDFLNDILQDLQKSLKIKIESLELTLSYEPQVLKKPIALKKPGNSKQAQLE